jgi:hypothetical protein
MKIKELYIIILLISIIILFYLYILKWVSYLFKNFYIQTTIKNREGFNNFNNLQINNNLVTDIQMPITTDYKCNNFCGPKKQCLYTREQCFSDGDCKGCELKRKTEEKLDDIYKAYNSNGKLIYNQNPQYSELTTDIGTFATELTKNSKEINPPQLYYGLDKWTNSFNYGLALYNRKLTYKYMSIPDKLKFLPNYPIRQTATGLFFDSGPLPSNYYNN